MKQPKAVILQSQDNPNHYWFSCSCGHRSETYDNYLEATQQRVLHQFDHIDELLAKLKEAVA